MLHSCQPRQPHESHRCFALRVKQRVPDCCPALRVAALGIYVRLQGIAGAVPPEPYRTDAATREQ
ncbi:hypothetical protein SBA4_360027 [Candidatus Sulfopaludibacter sp. SbA4]|nr:hypothetical protein SBA4_360027 [Candidatus Sulfopaludibacter sp. SbA4]